MYEYYTFPGGAQSLIQIFNAVAMISGSNSYTSLMLVGSLLGFMITMAVGIFKVDLKESISYILVVSFIWIILMVPKTSVVIIEGSGYNISPTAHRVDNIPFGLAVSSSMISKIGFWMTKSTEQVFTLPNDLNYSETGVLFGNRMLRQIYYSDLTNPVLKKDWAAFVHQCSFFDMNLYNKYSMEQLISSSDLLTTLGNTNAVLSVTIHASNTGKETFATTCDVAYQQLIARTQADINTKTIPRAAQKLMGGMGWDAGSGLSPVDIYTSAGDSTLSYLFKNASASAQEGITQAAMINMIKFSEMQNASAMQDTNTLNIALANAQAERQWVNSQLTGGSQASSFLPVMRTVLEGILIGIFPFVIFLALVGGMMALKSLGFYLMSLFWLQLWGPISAIMNLILTSYSSKNIYSELAGDGQTIVNSFNILQAAVEGEAMAGYALWMVPTLAYALIFSGKGLANAMISMTGSGQTVGNTAGSQVGAGNASMGNTSYNTSSANKSALDVVYSDPGMRTTGNATGSYTQGGSNAGTMSVNKSDLPVSGNTSAIMSSSYTQAAQTLNNWAKGQEQQAMQSLSSASTNAFALTSSYGNTQASNDTIAANSSASVQSYMAQNQAAAREITAGTEYADDVAFQNKLVAGLNAGIGFDAVGAAAKIRGDGTASRTATSSIAEKYGQKLSANSKEDTGQRQEYLENVAKGVGFSNTDSAGQAYQQSLSNSLAQTATSSQMAKEARTLSKSYAETASQLASTGGAITVDQNNLIGNIARENGMTLDQIKQNPEGLAQAVQSGIESKIVQMNQATAGTSWDSNPKGTTVGVGHVPDMGGSVKASGDAAVYDSFNTSQADMNEASEPVRTSNQGITRQQQSLQQGYDANHSGVVANVDSQASSVNLQGQHVRDLGTEAKDRGTGTVAQTTISQIARTGKDEETNSQTRLGVVSNHGGLGSGQTTFKFNSQLNPNTSKGSENSQGKGEASQE